MTLVVRPPRPFDARRGRTASGRGPRSVPRAPATDRACPTPRCDRRRRPGSDRRLRMVDSRCAITSDVRPVSAVSQRVLDRGLRLAVEVRGRLVEDDDARPLEQHPGDRQPLLLAARHPVAAVADHGVEAFGERRHEPRSGRPPSRSTSSPSVASGRARARLARMVSWNRCASWLTTPIASRRESSVTPRTSTPPMRTAPRSRRTGGRRARDRRLAGPRSARPAPRAARFDAEVRVVQHVDGAAVLGQ